MRMTKKRKPRPPTLQRMTKPEAKRPRWVILTLSLMPLWLGLSAGGAVWWSLRSDKQAEEERDQRFAMGMSVQRIADDLRKLEGFIGPRHTAEPQSRKALGRAASMLEGLLGPSNTGYLITKLPGPEGFPLICASLKSAERNPASLWVMAAYDTGPRDDPDNWPGSAAVSFAPSSSAVASLVAAAQAMARDQIEVDIHFLLVPHGNDPDSPYAEMVPKLLQAYPRPTRIFLIQQMADSPDLVGLVPGNQSDAWQLPGDLVQTMASNILPEFLDSVAKTGIPVVGVQTRLQGMAPGPDKASHLAISSGKLVEWLRRSARLEAAR